MKKPPTQPLEVEVRGGDEITNTLVYGVVQTSLRDAGFVKVKAVHPYGDADSAREPEMSGLLGVLHVTHPKLFTAPITVKQNTKGLYQDYNAPNHLVESFVYGNDEYDGQLRSIPEIIRMDQAKKLIERINREIDPVEEAREEVELGSKFLKHFENPASRAVLEDLFGEKVADKDIDDMRRELEESQKRLEEAERAAKA